MELLRNCHRQLGLLLAVLALLCFTARGAAQSRKVFKALAETPPRGWNSYDSFSWIISEKEFLQNAEFVAANLLKHGYEYVVVDFLWYRKNETGASVWSPGFEVIDEWGRLLPDPRRWPSTKDGKGFKPIADRVHALGLKFGIHVMRGLSTMAYERNTLIIDAKGSPEGDDGRSWAARDIGLPRAECGWMKACFMSVNTTTEGGRAFINSLYQQYAEWGVDFIKHDCVFGMDDLSVDEITAVSKAITRTGRPIVYSLSPGVRANPEMAKEVAHLTHMYRVTSDDWDKWWDVLLHFAVARDFAAAGLLGGPGLQGSRSWPDLDMLPLGWLTDPGAAYGPYRRSSLSQDEQRTQVTLWAIAKSPLMYGGDLRHIDQWTLDLITNPTVLEMNAHSTFNNELQSSVGSTESLPVVKLEDCVSATTTQWKLQSSVDGSTQVCWSHSSRSKYSRGQQEAVLEGCLNWTERLWPPKALKSGFERGLLWRSGTQTLCLEADYALTYHAKRQADFSPCNNNVSQVWFLTSEGKLLSEYLGFCAVVVQPEDQWRIWVARGSSGQSYVAFFNLGENQKTLSVSVKEVLESLGLQDAANTVQHQFSGVVDGWRDEILKLLNKVHRHNASKVYPKRVLRKPPWKKRASLGCTGIDVWKGESVGGVTSTLEATVEPHGTTLIELTCVRSPRFGPISMGLLIALSLASLMAGLSLLLPRKFWCSRERSVTSLERPLISKRAVGD